MALKYADRVAESTVTVGTGDIFLAGPVDADHDSFANQFADTETMPVVVFGGGKWMTFEGRYNSGANSITRINFRDSSTGAPISLSGTMTVMCVWGAADAVAVIRSDGAQALTASQQKQALSNSGAWDPGDAKLTFRSTATQGWFLCDDGSIGDASSGATTRANADTADCFGVLYNITSLIIQDSTGATVARGANAAADFAAHRRLVIPKTLGRAIAVAGSGSGLTARLLGTAVGSETETPTIAKTASHPHRIITYGENGNSGPFNQLQGVSASSAAAGLGGAPNPNTENTGGGAPLNIIPPEFFMNIAIKL